MNFVNMPVSNTSLASPLGPVYHAADKGADGGRITSFCVPHVPTALLHARLLLCVCNSSQPYHCTDFY